MRYLSLFSGIEAASAAWKPLGWECVAVSEILEYQSNVIKHHYPDVKNFGDVTKITDEDIKALGNIDVVIFGSPCFPADTLVLTSEGYIPIQCVKVGDLVLTHLGRWKPVLRVGGTTKETVILKGFGHQNLEASYDHPFMSKSKFRRWNKNTKSFDVNLTEVEWADAKDMSGKFWATPNKIESLNVPIFNNQNSKKYNIAPETGKSFWWMVGRWLGDGWLRTSKRRSRDDEFLNQIVICCGKHEDIENELTSTGMHWGKTEERTTYKFISHNTPLCEWLKEHFGEYSYGKRIPSWIYGMDDELKKSLLDGYHSADGCVLKDGMHKISTVSKQLALGIRLLLENLGYTTSLCHFDYPREGHTIEGRVVKSIRPTYSIRWFSDKNKTNRQHRDFLHTWGLVRSVENTNESKIVYNLEVEEDNTYVVENIVVHNCQDMSVAGKRGGLETVKDDTNHSSILFYEGMRVFRLAQKYCGARFLVWENVPGALSSNNGEDFGKILSEMVGVGFNSTRRVWGNEGGAFGDSSMCEWSVLDAQWFGVAQRRRRLFVVLDTGDWKSREPILLESDRMRGDTSTLRKERKTTTEKINGCSNTTSIFDMQAIGEYGYGEVASTLKARDYKDSTDLVVDGYTCAIVSNVIGRNPETRSGGNGTGFNEDVMYTLTGSDHHAIAYNQGGIAVVQNSHVRRLTPIECELLQGFEAGYTDLGNTPFSKRINALGRSMAVPVIKWIGESIERSIRV